jgi:mannose/cellobiose epimerase-like protein (N-acyl-D-glucosamine 2-epimerase family)
MTTQGPPSDTAGSSFSALPVRPGDPVSGGRWTEQPTHLAWLDDQLRALVRFSLGTVRPDGGFHYPAADGTPQPGRGVELFLTARMTHMASIAHLRGIPGAGRLLDHGVRSLSGVFVDGEHGGFVSSLGNPSGRKMTYDQVHVGLAASSASAAGHPDAGPLLDQVAEVIDTHLWEADEGMLRESFAADWSDCEEYRGANATMHGVEAFLAMGDVTGDPRWHHRAYGMADRIVNVGARALGWLVPEHFDARWQVDLDYNADQPDHPFRPYGATYGHLLEWARFLVNLDASPVVAPSPWLLEAAQSLTESALSGWGADGVEGMVYTVGWDRHPVSRLRLHWPVCEGIQACAAIDTATGGSRWEAWYRTLWDHASRFIDEQGTWVNELDTDLRPSGTVWPGRPDVYHCVGAYTVPTVPATPFMTLALAGEESRLTPPPS